MNWSTPGVGQLAQLGDVLVGRAQDAEPVGHLVADERGVRRADLGVVVVVVALAVADVAGQARRQLLARVLVDEVDDVVRDERREPARPLAADLARADVGRRRRLDPDRAGSRPAAVGRLADLADEPADEVGVGELEDQPVGDAAGHRQGHRAVAGDPDRQRPCRSRAAAAPCPRTRPSGPRRAPDDPDRLLGVAIVVGGLPSTRRAESPRPMPRSIRPPDSSSSVASADAVTDGSRVPGLVTQVPRRSRVVASAISVSRGRARATGRG